MKYFSILRGRLSKYLRHRRAASGKRNLVNEILLVQIVTVGFIGVLAVASLYWGGQWVLKDNYSRWALQWTEELNELGSPMFAGDDNEAMKRLEGIVERYSEIRRVVYFDKMGRELFSVDGQDVVEPVRDLSRDKIDEAIAVIGDEKPYLMDSGLLDPRRFEVLAPVLAGSLVGFVGINLDFAMFHGQFMSKIHVAILLLIVFLILFGVYSRNALRRALTSISDLQEPIRQLAKGNLGVRFEPAVHQEISEIVEALETTASALGKRDAKLLELANHDSLTGLFNRRRFVEELKQEVLGVKRHGSSSALLFIDLDQFKYVNDACGHAAGDRLIRKVADALRHSVRRDDIVGRFGGDEFVILVRRTDARSARTSAQTILDNMRSMAHIEGDKVFHIHCSIGIALIDGKSLHYDDLINQADIACREAKSAGRNRMHYYEHSQVQATEKVADVGWMSRLREALEKDLFQLHFQPINDVGSGETTHHEVLIRLMNEDGTLVFPDAFLPSAARFGLMAEIDFWMIRHAAMAYAKYSRPDRVIKLSINLSANAFENEDLFEYVKETFHENRVLPTDIILEITESLAVRRPAHVERQLDALRGLGCQFALDDFGTGYSSFSHLQKLKFDYIKIDGTFVRDLLNNPVDQKMIRLIAEIGHESGMRTIAEYVQDAESLELLGELGVDMVQGYFIGRPTAEPECKPTPVSLSLRRERKYSGGRIG